MAGAANTLDFFGGGSSAGSLDNPLGRAAYDEDPLAKLMANQAATDKATTLTRNTNAAQAAMPGSDTGGASYNPALQAAASASGNIGGASGEYNTGSDSGRGQLDYYHDLNSGSGITSALNKMGESVGISHAGDVAGDPLGSLGKVAAPWDVARAATAQTVDPNKGLGQTSFNVGDAQAGKPLSNMTPETRAVATTMQSPSSLGDLVNGVTGNGGSSVDTSGGDRGTSKIPGIDDAQQLANANGTATQLGTRGNNVLTGQTAPGGQGQTQQQNALEQSLGFLQGPRAQGTQLGKVNAFNPTAQNDVMTNVKGFLTAPDAPSAAQAQLQQGNQAAMSDALSIARSGRARDAGSQARALNVATAENASTNVDAARNAAALRATEAQQAKANQLSALGISGNVASGIDQSKLSALGLGSTLSSGLDTNSLAAIGQQGDIASQMRNANTTERGQTLGYDQGMQATGAGLTQDVLKTIPQIEQVNHSDQFDLTPEQKLAQTQIAANGPPRSTLDYILGLGKDLLPLAK